MIIAKKLLEVLVSAERNILQKLTEISYKN